MKKIKVLMLSDHPLSPTGVGTQARWLIDGLVNTGRYSFRCFGGAIKHERYDVVRVSDDFLILPTDGYGTPDLVRRTLVTEKPDVLLLFTDPRFFLHVFETADEIRTMCPIAYNHLWDSDPYPRFNDPFYDECDLINCINWPTYQMLVGKRKRVNFIPHGVPGQVFYPEPAASAAVVKARVLGADRAGDFVVGWVGRNARRKRPNDALVAWKAFLARIDPGGGKRPPATLLMHTNPLDPEGPNLIATMDMLGLNGSVKFSTEMLDFPTMRQLYSVCDVVMNTSMNEGFGVPTLEAMMCGKPIVAPTTGGLTRQVINHRTGEHNGVALPIETRTLVGGQLVPYIYEDLVGAESIAGALEKLHSMPPAERVALGARAREYALSEFSLESVIRRWDESLSELVAGWRVEPRVRRIR